MLSKAQPFKMAITLWSVTICGRYDHWKGDSLKVRYFLAAMLFETAVLLAQSAPPLAAAPATASSMWRPTAELNERLPNWLRFDGTYRIRVEGQDGIGFKSVSDTHALGQLQIGVKIQPVAWLSFYGQTQDSRIYLNGPVAKAPPYQNTWDIHQAWGEVGSLTNYHFKIRTGRQVLNFGESRLVGESPWLNAPRVFDAVLATVAFSGVQIDTFASSVVNSVDGTYDHHKQGNPLYGIYGTLSKLVPKASIEPYVFWRLAPSGYAAAYADGAKGKLDETTYGFRFAGTLPAQFDYGTEMARQSGTLGADSIDAWAGHWVVGRTFALKFKPRPFVEYNYASGNSSSTSTHLGTFDQLYPSGHDKFGVVDQVGWRNIRDLRAGLQVKPVSKLTISAVYHDFWLANAHDGLYAANGSVLAKSLSGAAGTHVGQEIDIQGFYKLNNAVQFGSGFGHLAPGEFLKATTLGHAYNYPFATLTYAF